MLQDINVSKFEKTQSNFGENIKPKLSKIDVVKEITNELEI